MSLKVREGNSVFEVMYRVTGKEDQYIGFNAAGEPVAKDLYVPSESASLFCMEVDQTEGNPYNMVRYFGDNANYRPAHMDFAANMFDMGDWGDAWFIKELKPVLMGFDGSIIAELDKADYTKNRAGVEVDITSSGNGNVMIGVPTVWIKVDTTNVDKPRIYFSKTQIDNTYHAYAHEDVNGNIMSYTYIAAYEAYYDGTSYRSASGIQPSRNTNYATEISYAGAVNTRGSLTDIWNVEAWGDRVLIQLLLMLIGKSCNTQEVFGNGNDNGYYSHPDGSDGYGVLPTGTMNQRGLFWGSSSHELGVKVFGIEHFWGNIWKRLNGLINDNGAYRVKMCRSTSDGSSGTSYNATGSGYRSAGYVPSASASYITYLSYPLLIPDNVSGGSSSTKYSDAMWSNNGQVNVAFVGGDSGYGLHDGAFALSLNDSASVSYWGVGARLSAKPKVS